MRGIMSFAVKLVWSSYETWSLVWAVATVTANGAASWGGTVALLIAFTEWPLWQQIAVSAGVALVWLTILNWVIGLFKKPEQPAPVGLAGPTQTIEGQSNVGQQMTDSSHSLQAGRDINIDKRASSPVEKISLREAITRAVKEADHNIGQRGRQRRFNIRRHFADTLYNHAEYLKLDDWPEIMKTFEVYYENLTMQCTEAPLFEAYQHEEHFRPNIIETAKAFTHAAQAFLDRPPITIIG